MATEVETQVATTWTVTFVDGTYNFRCDPHAAQMKGSFTVGNVPPPPPPPGKLSGKVTAKAITLNTASGSRVRSVVENTYKLTVADSSNKQNFHLTGPGVNKKTGIRAKTRATWTVQAPAREVHLPLGQEPAPEAHVHRHGARSELAQSV